MIDSVVGLLGLRIEDRDTVGLVLSLTTHVVDSCFVPAAEPADHAAAANAAEK